MDAGGGGGRVHCVSREGIELVGRDHCLCGEIRAVFGGDLRLYEQGGSGRVCASGTGLDHALKQELNSDRGSEGISHTEGRQVVVLLGGKVKDLLREGEAAIGM